MEAHIVPDFLTRGHRVYLIERVPVGRRMILRFVEGQSSWEEIHEATEPDASLHLPEGALETLLKAAEGYVPATEAVLVALMDTRDTRDRLLALIEKRGLR